MMSWITGFVFTCTLWSVEARSFKRQETALVEESVKAVSTCFEWSQPEVTCVGTGLSETGKSDTECKQWCESQGAGCCETKTTGACTFVAGDASSEWSSGDTDSRTTYCIDEEYTTWMNDDGGYVTHGCGWDGDDAVGQSQFTDIANPTLIQCQDACTARSEPCFFTNWGGGGCRLYTTCIGSAGGYWMMASRVNPCAASNCTAVDGCHVAGTCDLLSGTCTNPHEPDGAVCDDGDSSTTSSQCSVGVCTGTAAGATGDPHFVGFDGSRYDFQGSPGSVFNLITDKAFQLNARFVEAPTDGKTYMGVVAAKVGSNTVVITPDVVVVNDRSVANGEHVYLYDGEESLGLLIVDKDRVHVKALSFQVDIIIVHEGGFVYLNVNAAANSDHLVHPHGILGQTAQYLVDGSQPNPVRLSHKNLYASGFLIGSPDDYLVTDGLLGIDFTFNRFGLEASTVRSEVSRRFGFARVLYQQQV